MTKILQPGVHAEASDDSAYLALTGGVGWEITAGEVARALGEAGGKPVTVDIFSYGGDAFEGLAIYQLLKNYSGSVTTSVLGLAASAGSVIAMGGSKRRVPKNAALMIHSAWSLAIGDAEEMRRQANVLDGVTDALIGTYVEASGRPAEEIRPYVEQETWLYGEDAFALGLATEVSDPVEAMASLRGDFRAAITRLPENLRGFIQLAAPQPEPEPESAPAPAAEPEDSVHSISTVNPAEDQADQAASHSMTMNAEAAAAARQAERERMMAISGLCAKHGIPDSKRDEFLNSDMSLAEAQSEILETIGARKHELRDGAVNHHGAPEPELDAKRPYSLMNVVNYLVHKDHKHAQAAGYELEISREMEKSHGKSANGVLVPWSALGFGRPMAAAETPGQTVGTFGDGGALVGTQRLDGSFIDLIRNRSAFMGSGMTVISGLEGNVEIPKKLGSSSYYFVGENADVTNSNLTFGLVNMIPRTIGVRVPISRRMMLQASPDIEALVRTDMAESMALGIDKTTGYGTGSNGQPLGILNTAGIGSVTLGGGTSKVFPASLGGGTHDCGDWADYVDLETALAVDNLDMGALGYVLNSVVGGALKQTLRASAAGSDYIMTDAGEVNGYPVTISNQMEQNDVLFGNFADGVLGFWGGVDLTIDPYTQSANGQVILTVMQDFDVAVRRPQSFALGT